MLQGAKLEFFDRYNSVLDQALKGNDTFPDQLCNFLTSEFELQASVIFQYDSDKFLRVLGKSNSAKKNFLSGSKFNCSVCQLKDSSSNPEVYSDNNCEIQISEYVLYESCAKFKINNNERGLLKIAKQNPLSKSESDALKKIANFTGHYLNIWSSVRSGNTLVSKVPFCKVVNKTLQEFRTPTNTIIGFTSILSEENLTSSQNEYAATIKTNAQKLLVSINDALELTKIECGELKTQKVQTNIRTLCQEVIDLYQEKYPGIDFSLDIKDSALSSIKTDKHKLRFILNNILLFSVNVTQKGNVKITVDKRGSNQIEFAVEDNSRGISQESVNKIFEPFEVQKLEELKETSITGLTFTLIEKYIGLLNGDINIESTSASGIKITFTLKGETMSNIENSISKIPKPTSENKVLVIEDDYATSKLLSNYLTKWGYKPQIVNTEEQTLKIIEKESFLAIIMDIALPNTNGLELLRKIHNHPRTKNIPVIVASVEAEQQKAFMMGAVEYFQKPINYNFLVEVLTSYKLRKDSNVLCVDDDEPTLNLIKQAIETAGFHAVAESDSSKVMDLIKDKQLDLAIIDLDMPHPNGFELIKLIKSNKKFEKLPVIIYTGKENYQEDLESIDGLFEDLLEKRSTNIEDLQDTIASMISQQETPPPVEEVIEKEDVTKILLAEDYKHSQIIVTRLLKKNGFENIVVVENGEEAVEMVNKEQFSLILMDMQMPVMNGFEATEKIREIPEYQDTPIISLTAFAMKGDRDKCLEVGATDYIPKPIDSKEFIDKVKYYTNVTD
jgi:CheY-like chemotaxis protein